MLTTLSRRTRFHAALILFALVLVLASCAQQSAPTALPTPRLSTLAAPTATPTTPVEPTAAPTEAPAFPEATPTEAAPNEAAPTPEASLEATAEATQDPTGSPTTTGCVNKAGFFGDVNIPDDTSFKQNTPFTKTWKVRNEGDCVWDGYKLVFAGGETLDGAFANPMPVIQPGQVQDISIDLVSPPQGGIFTSVWELESADGQRFGFNSNGKDMIWVRISVSWYPDGGGGPHLPVVQGCSPEPDPGFESQILTLVNAARAAEGLPALTMNEKLTAAARFHSTDMACLGIRDHTGSDGSNWNQRIAAQGYKASSAAENIYYGHPDFGADVAGTFNWWMGSTVHRNNILSKKATEIGVGYVYLASGDGWGYTTLVIARP